MKKECFDCIRSIPKWILLVVSIVSVLLIVIPTTLYLLSENETPLDAVDHGITIDASSSKTKFTLYDWLSIKENGTGLVNEVASEKLDIRIDKYASNLLNLVGSLRTTMEKVSNKINDSRQSHQVPIYLGATAGMRLLNAINSEDSDRILEEIRTDFERFTAEQKRFQVENVEIISGEKEGLYAWIATNYLMDYVPPRNRPINSTVGILEMGGASAQIAFQTLCKTKDGCMLEEELTNLVANEKVELFDILYDVYTYSNLCFGNDEARRRYQLTLILDQLEHTFNNYVDDPCTHTGQMDRTISKDQLLLDVCTNNDLTETSLKYETYVFKARPDIEKCQELTKRLVNEAYVEKYFGGNHMDFKTMEESPPADMPFYALATYYYTMSQVRHNGTLRFEDEGELRKVIDEYCSRSWDDLVRDVNDADKQLEYLHNYCFSMNFIFMYLKHVHKFSGKQFGKIEFRQKLVRGDLSWTLGYMLQATNSISTDQPLLGTSLFISLLVIGIMIALVTAAIFVISMGKFYQGENTSTGRVEFGLSSK